MRRRTESLEFFVPSNRVDRNGRRRGMDGLNEIVRQSRGNRFAAAKRKAENELHVARYAGVAAYEAGWAPDDRLHTVVLTFIEPDMRRDDDNVFAAAKYVLDALCSPTRSGASVVHANGVGIVPDDDPLHVCLVCRRGETDRDNPGIRVKVIRCAAGAPGRGQV